MHITAGKIQGNKRKLATGEIAHKQRNSESSFPFTDNRPTALVQSTLQEMAGNSPQIQRLEHFQKIASNRPGAKHTAQLQKNDSVVQRLIIHKAAGHEAPIWQKRLFKARMNDKTATTGTHNYAIDVFTGAIEKSGTSGHAEILLLTQSAAAMGEPVILVSEYKPCKSCQAAIKKVEESRGIDVRVLYLLDYEEKGDGDTEATRQYYKGLGFLTGGGPYVYTVSYTDDF